MTDYPDEYIPESLRVRKKKQDVAFAIGYRKGASAEYGMTNGPFPTLQEALDTVPDEENDYDTSTPYIIRFDENGDGIPVYKWRSNKWVRYVTRS